MKYRCARTFLRGAAALSLLAAAAGAAAAEPGDAVDGGAAAYELRSALLEDAEGRGFAPFYAEPDKYAPVFDGRLQFRYVYNHRERREPKDTTGFVYRRVRVGVEGDLNDWLSYSVELAADRSDGSINLNDASIGMKLGDGWSLMVGRFRPAFLREEIVSSSKQMLVERSLVALTFTQPYNTGAQLMYMNDWLKFTGSAVDRGGDLGGDERWAYLSRAEALLTGEWKSFRDFTSDEDRPLGVLIGAAVAYDQTDTEDPFRPDPEYFRWTADISVEYENLSVFAAVVGNQLDEDLGSGRLDQYGVVLQAGYHLSDEWEVVGRYEWGTADGAAKELNVLSAGFNYYIAGHALKWSTDAGYGFNEVNGFWSSTGAGWLTDRTGQDGQVVVRSQLQILF